MWLLPAFSRIAALVTRTFFRLSRSGDAVPRSGAVLLVANHPNSLLDPAMVAAAAQRPVRFLAKAPLFSDPLVGWLVRGAGAIPVYRHRDDPTQISRNSEMFSAVRDALVGGSAVGIFPEGISHAEPSLSPLKTGAARIALEAAQVLNRDFPIIPVGLVFRARDRFRSEAMIIVGEPIAWSDLTGRPSTDADAVRELTARIDAALRRVTVNLERWEDASIVECAEAIHAAEFELDRSPAARVTRLKVITERLKRLRESNDPRWETLARDVARHERLLRRLRLQPTELHRDASARQAARWTVRQLPYSGLMPLTVMVLGGLLFWIPYRLTGAVARRTAPQLDAVSTHKALYGIVIFAVWIVLLAVIAGVAFGPVAALIAIVALPVIALAVLSIGERWRGAWGEAQRFMLRVRRGELIEHMKERQRDLAQRLEQLRQERAPLEAAPRVD